MVFVEEELVSKKVRVEMLDIPYGAKFPRHIIFVVFADWSTIEKIKLLHNYHTL